MKTRYAIVFLIACTILTERSGLAGSAPSTQTFASPDEAATALVDALKTGKADAIENILGPASAKLAASGDPVSDAAERQKFLAAYEEHHELVATASDRTVIQVGNGHWPLPIPLELSDGRWHFDAPAGALELIDRRIGRNEIAAIRTSLAYVDAQKAFFALTGENGQAEYAQRLVSSPDKHDGLYWAAAEGEPESPLASLVAQAEEQGYPGAQASGKPQPYQGYFFRILTGQGPDSPEGALDYVSDGRMTKGFALIAWPASYGASGIMSFEVNQDGTVFQKDLGPRTSAIASTTKLFDPDLTWARVDVVN